MAMIGIISAFFAPWFVPAACIVFLCICYPAWEVLLIALLMDLLWLPGAGFSVPYFLVGSIALVWLCAPLRSQFLST
ncbi:hypothetical protein A3A41_00045 [Candidatus Kaiserbacteria bacterium RIFCSPLOWO2_01_FULL_54_22]|nr:MAG: hypothetical protein A3A41_00045 [Candidatus Kaiserbacteria bacterium RIFCSPLOWO2_01_FULL_54_22]